MESKFFFPIIVLPWSPLFLKALKVLELGGNTDEKGLRGETLLPLSGHAVGPAGILVPQPGIEPTLPAWKFRLLTIDPPGKSLKLRVFHLVAEIINYVGLSLWALITLG